MRHIQGENDHGKYVLGEGEKISRVRLRRRVSKVTAINYLPGYLLVTYLFVPDEVLLYLLCL